MNQCTEGQPFAKNYNPSYALGGLIGHTGIDEGCGYGTPIFSVHDGFVYKVLTPANPANDGSGFTGVFMIVDDGLECFEWLVGHCDPQITESSYVAKGTQIGTEANHGEVYSGNMRITLAMQKAGNHEGAHRHYQKRPVMPVAKTDGAHSYLSGSAQSPYRYGGDYFQIFNYNNGFNGCTNPMAPVFNRDLTVGFSGYDVFVLQRLLGRKGHLTAEPTGFFGLQTAAAVCRFQIANAIAGTSYFGPKTRSLALRELSPLPVLGNY